ncbi:hypothetical protein AVEN_220018-1 [Araneus ventricosus]|uniref:Uncharacterized protein n=1 Tax=Araneus ventricosus TaxID=182803 RepID=A0A4Y2CQ55_ARAVE|nr:hypothetical protein AVEN_220018-1 [Araneus ventricosus]
MYLCCLDVASSVLLHNMNQNVKLGQRELLSPEANIACIVILFPGPNLKPCLSASALFAQFSENGCFKRFHLSDSDYCSCGGIGTALHYVTECIHTVSWHMRKPAPNFEQKWLKRVSNSLVSRHKIRGIIKFINENRDLFRRP